MMLSTPIQMREQSRLCREAARETNDATIKRRLAGYALALAQVAEQLATPDRSRRVVKSGPSDQSWGVAAEALGEEARQFVKSLLNQKRTGPYSFDQIRQWRLRAEELRTIADQFTIPTAQDSLRIAARNYEQLAKAAEAQLMGRDPLPRGKAG